MASTPHMDTRSPLTLLNIAPKEHEKAIKQAFYNTAANFFVLIACAAGVAVYFILEAFLKPLLWAVLCGAFLNPFKSFLTNVLRNWLNGIHRSHTPFIVGLVITPIKFVDGAIDTGCNLILQKIKLLAGLLCGATAVYLLWHFGPLQTILSVVQGLFFFMYDLLGYFTSFWIWSLALAYFVVIIFFWSPESRTVLRYMSVPVWLLIILHVAATAGILRVPLLFVMGIGITVGFVAQRNEAQREQQEGIDPNRKSIFESAVKYLVGESPTESHDTTNQSEDKSPDPSDQSEAKEAEVETIGATATSSETIKGPSEISKPSTLNVKPGVALRRPLARSKLVTTPVTDAAVTPTRSLSDQSFIALLWAIILTRVWMHIWLFSILLPIPVAIWIIKKLTIKLCSSDGPAGDKVKVIRKALGTWIRDRKEVLMPKWLQGVARLVIKGDQKIISLLESSLDKTTSILFILLLLVGTTLFSIVFAVQVQRESMYLVQTTSNLLNDTLHPEMANWLPNNEDMHEAMDSMVGNAYLYGRNWIASKVRDMVNGGAEKNTTHIEDQVLDLWDRLYDSWLARNATSASTSLTKVGSDVGFDISNLTSIWELVTQGDGFNFGVIISFVKENIGTFMSVLESIWLVLKGNMSLVVTVLTSAMSLLFGGGTAVLNFIISSVIFLTTLFYLLASSGDQYKPVEWFSAMSPPAGGGNTFGQAVQDAVSGVFMASLKMATFYGFYTWLTHTLFGVNIVFIPSALAAVFGAVPFVGTYLAAIPAVLELWLVQDQSVMAILLLVCHFLPSYVVDTAIYSEIKGGHPYMTGLAIAGGMYWIGLEGAIFGPIILCCLIVLASVYGTMMKPESPSFARSHSVL